MQEGFGECLNDPVRQRLGVARAGWLQVQGRQDRQCGFTFDQGHEAAIDHRRVGTRLLPGLSEPPRGLRQRCCRQTDQLEFWNVYWI